MVINETNSIGLTWTTPCLVWAEMLKILLKTLQPTCFKSEFRVLIMDLQGWACIKQGFASPLDYSVWVFQKIWKKWAYFLTSYMRPSHGNTTSKQEFYKLKIFIIGLFNPSMRHVSWWHRLIQEFVHYKKISKWASKILIFNISLHAKVEVRYMFDITTANK